MRPLVAWVRRLTSIFSADRRDRELTAELEGHVALDTDARMRSGMSAAEASRQARLHLGGVQQTRERYRDAAGWSRTEALVRDVRLAARGLAQRKALVLATTVSIGLGVGINLAVYSVLQSVLFAGGWIHGAQDPDRLVSIWPGLSYPNYTDLVARQPPVDVVALQAATLVWRGPQGNVGLGARIVSSNFFDVLGGRALRGDVFHRNPSAAAADTDVVVVSFAFWQRQLSADPAVVGRNLNLNGWPFRIAAVLPSGLKAPVGPMVEPSVFVPIGDYVNTALADRGAAQFDLIGRLAPGVSRDQAQAALRAVGRQIETAFPNDARGLSQQLRVFDGGTSPVQMMLSEAPQGRPILALGAVVFVLVGLVLLIACANVAGLLTARVDERRHEIAVRTALGASRGRLVQQLLAESFVIGALGCAAGMLLWQAAATIIPRLPIIVNTGMEISPEATPPAYAIGLLFVVTAACGLAPALAATQVKPLENLKAARQGFSVGGFHLQHLLVAGQVAVAVVLLTAAAILLHTAIILTRVEPGYDVGHTASLSLRLPPGQSPRNDVAGVKRAIEQMPGVQSVAFGDLPLALLPRTTTIRRTGDADATGWPIEWDPVGAGYLTTMGIPLVRGADFADAGAVLAHTETPAIVNETFARRYAPDPIGRTFVLDRDEDSGRPALTLRVVGVARDVKVRSLADEDLPVVWVQRTNPGLVLRFSDSGGQGLRAAEEKATNLVPGALITVTTMADRVRLAGLPAQIAAALFGALGGIGLLLAMTGVYGLISCTVSRRAYEIGVRMALGARPGSIVRLVLQRTMALIGAGFLVGAATALFAAQLMTPLLAAGQSTIDGVAVLFVLLILALAAASASLWPARRSARIDSVTALRSE